MEKIVTEQIGTYFKIKPEAVGSIAHVVLIKDGRASFYENEYSKTPKQIAITSAATLDEVNKLIAVLDTVRDLMLASELDEALEEPTLEVGTLVETNDGRYGIVKKIDWYSEKVMGRKDLQIQFPNGVGIFRRDEVKPCPTPPTL